MFVPFWVFVWNNLVGNQCKNRNFSDASATAAVLAEYAHDHHGRVQGEIYPGQRDVPPPDCPGSPAEATDPAHAVASWDGWGQSDSCRAVSTIKNVSPPPGKSAITGAIPNADHILAQPLKRCSASRIKPNETFKLAKKRPNILCFGVRGRRISLRCRQVTSKVPKTVEKSLYPTVLELRWSFRHDKMKIWLYLYFQHVMRYIGTDFVQESRQKMQRSEEEHFFREGCFDRKECISKTANKRCSRQVLQLRCSLWYSIKFYT